MVLETSRKSIVKTSDRDAFRQLVSSLGDAAPLGAACLRIARYEDLTGRLPGGAKKDFFEKKLAVARNEYKARVKTLKQEHEGVDGYIDVLKAAMAALARGKSEISPQIVEVAKKINSAPMRSCRDEYLRSRKGR